MHAFKLPKSTDKEKKYRKKAIEQATIKAIEIPEKIADIALSALEKVDFIRKYGNKNAISDVGVSALMLYAGLEGACLNIKINLSGLSDQGQKHAYKDKVQSLLNEGTDIKAGCMRAIHDVLDEG
jgi:formiminotetrahydrofolate cyclodeaminase